MAAPVIWFGSWLLSVMTCSLACSLARLPDALCLRGFFQFPFREIKKGLEGAPCTPPEFEWPQPSPAVRLGTTTIRSLVIILRIWQLKLPKDCAVIAAIARMSRQGRARRDVGRLAGFRRFGECEFAALAQN